ncbi:sugar phosphate isomerase/epimerase family protein [Paenibacillus sp. HB172176]|uniref:sugar phosphate isomerase/epimerase family protein n=1 Tax=Paenibacillus sp. HB172176 TaxID=2493690 RepID=UPI00143B1630|nr:sugar phosphate isomerase/epimerase family protein [Paenibacillus sp. HB172176]
MKYAFVSFSCPHADLSAIIAMAGEYGYAGIEIRSGAKHGHGIELGLAPEAVASIRAKLSSSSVDLHCLSVSCHYSNPDTLETNMEESKAYIRLAGELGAPLLRVFCGIIPKGLDRLAAREQIGKALSELAPLAEAAGVTLAVETHDDWSDPEEMAAIMKIADHPAVGVVWDIMHTLRTGNTAMDEAYRILKPWLCHVHFHDGLLDRDKLTFLPVGEGEIDHRSVVSILMEEGYEGFLSGEWLDWEAPDIHLPREIATMRRYEEAGC